MSVSTSPEAPKTKRDSRAQQISREAGRSLPAIIAKLIGLGIVDAIAVYATIVLAGAGSWLMVVIVAAVAILINYIYFSHRALPAKYLAPGVFFLVIFQVFVLLYTGFIAFTNYGTGHNGSKEQALSSLMATSLERVPDSPTYPLTVVDRDGELGFLVTTGPGEAKLGTAEIPLEAVSAEFTGDTATAVDGWTSLKFADVIARQNEVTAMSVAASDDPNDGFLQTPDGQRAYQYTSALEFDAASDTLTNTKTGVVYHDNGEGAFESSDGQVIMPGWRVTVGFDNFTRAVTDKRLAGPLAYVTAWTFAFAFLSVLTTFGLGLFLAIVFNNQRMKGRKIYRSLLILPYAVPSFLSALIWAGMMNQSFGFLNNVVFAGASIPWLTDPWMAKVSVLLVNLWLGFPYMFLVCMGALQSIPDEVQEAATVDGAKPFQIFRHIKLPLLLVSVAPLLISSFAFNFNNFNIVYMLTGGGPRDPNAPIPVGHTDLLISMVYKVAFTGQSRDYGLASAFSILVFLIVATVSIIAFRRTKALEEVN